MKNMTCIATVLCLVATIHLSAEEIQPAPPTPKEDKAQAQPAPEKAKATAVKPAETKTDAETAKTAPAEDQKVQAPVAAPKPVTLAPVIRPGQAAIPELEDMTLVGKVIKVEMTTRSRDGREIKIPRYELFCNDGRRINLPQTRSVKNEPAIDFESFIDKTVKVTGKGRTRIIKDRTISSMLRLTSIEETKAELSHPNPPTEVPAAK